MLNDGLLRINSRIQVDAMADALTPANARALLGPYDVILDCTDNPPTRYLLSDTAVLLGKPLVSGAAQKLDGQLCTYNLGPEGPCYRCLFPRPPSSPGAAPSCEETGILGPVTGVVGSLQALEAIKIIVGLHGTSPSPPSLSLSHRHPVHKSGGNKKKTGVQKNADVIWCVCRADAQPSLLVYAALGVPPFRSVKLRKRRVACPACGTEGQKVGKIEEVDYVQFCGGARPDWEALGLNPGAGESRITASVRAFPFLFLPSSGGPKLS